MWGQTVRSKQTSARGLIVPIDHTPVSWAFALARNINREGTKQIKTHWTSARVRATRVESNFRCDPGRMPEMRVVTFCSPQRFLIAPPFTIASALTCPGDSVEYGLMFVALVHTPSHLGANPQGTWAAITCADFDSGLAPILRSARWTKVLTGRSSFGQASCLAPFYPNDLPDVGTICWR